MKNRHSLKPENQVAPRGLVAAAERLPVFQKEDWYNRLIEDCQNIIVEGFFTSRWSIVETYHQLGMRLLQDNHNFERVKVYGEKILQHVAESLRKSERTLRLAVRFAKKFPNLAMLKEGKDITWHKICRKYLPEKRNEIDIPLPEGKYGLIVIDPPWPYGTEYDAETRRVASPYNELGIQELEELQIPSAEDAVLWCWTTHRFLFDAKNLLRFWGFEYKLCMVWDKEKLGMGVWLRCQVEFCLLGIKGHPKWNMANERDIIREIRQEHSRKPDGFYTMAEKLTPVKNKLDMFSRRKIDGWRTWGNENNT